MEVPQHKRSNSSPEIWGVTDWWPAERFGTLGCEAAWARGTKALLFDLYLARMNGTHYH
jgi:hypothetical protein